MGRDMARAVFEPPFSRPLLRIPDWGTKRAVSRLPGQIKLICDKETKCELTSFKMSTSFFESKILTCSAPESAPSGSGQILGNFPYEKFFDYQNFFESCRKCQVWAKKEVEKKSKKFRFKVIGKIFFIGNFGFPKEKSFFVRNFFG